MASKTAPSLTAIRQANAIIRDSQERLNARRNQFIEDLGDTAALAIVSLDEHKEKIKDENVAKQIADGYGFEYVPREENFYKVQEDGTALKVSLDDMKSYKKISMETGDNFEQIFNKKGVKLLHTLSIQDYDDMIETYLKGGPRFKTKKGKPVVPFIGKAKLKSYTDSKNIINLLMNKGASGLVDFENTLNDFAAYDSKEGVVNSINSILDKEYGSLDEFQQDLKDGNLDAATLEKVASFGKFGDKYLGIVDNELVHLNPKEMYLKQMFGKDADRYIKSIGSGTKNDITGLTQYNEPAGDSGGGGWKQGLMKLGGAALSGSGLQIAQMAWNAIEGHQQDKIRVKQIGNQIKDLSVAAENQQNQKIDATENIIDTAEIAKNELFDSAGANIENLATTITNIEKAGKGLKTGAAELVTDKGQDEIQDQVELSLDSLENQTNQNVQQTGQQYDQTIADIGAQKEALERERESIKGSMLWKVGKWKPFG